MDDIGELEDLDKLIDSQLKSLEKKSSDNPVLTSAKYKLDENFNLVDNEGEKVKFQKPESSFLVNRPKGNERRKKKPKAVFPKPNLHHFDSLSFFDPSIEAKDKLVGRKRPRGALEFHKPGEFTRKAKKQRILDRQNQIQREVILDFPPLPPNFLDEPSDRPFEYGESQLVCGVESSPSMEPWDRPFLRAENYIVPPPPEMTEGEKVKLEPLSPPFSSKSLNGRLVEHPKEMNNNAWEDKVVPIPLMMTKKEQKRLRKKTRLAREMEKQQKIRVGLIPPPKPRATLTNFMQVYLSQGALGDPTALTQRIRKEMKERSDRHDQRNADRKLSKEERKEKKMTLEGEDQEKEIRTLVYLLGSLEHPFHRFKVSSFAKKFVVSGCVVIYKHRVMIVVEGGKRNIRRFRAKMSAMNWNIDTVNNEPLDFSMPENRGKTRNFCELCWEGSILAKKFNGFHFNVFEKREEVDEYVQHYAVDLFWDFVKGWKVE